MLIHCGSQTRSSFWVKLLRVIAALHKVFQCYSFTFHCFRAGETHAQSRSECGSYIVRARSLTKLATSAPDQECDCLANPVANFIGNIIWVCGFISDGKRISIGGNYELKLNYQINLHIGGPGWNWTSDMGIFTPLLYRLSYRTI